jgi:hypothetical protein
MLRTIRLFSLIAGVFFSSGLAHADPCSGIPDKSIATYGSAVVSIGAWCPGDGSLKHYFSVSAPDPNHPHDTSRVRLDNYENDAAKFSGIYNSENQKQISANDLVACIDHINANPQLNAVQMALLPQIENELKAITWPVTPAVLANIQAADVDVVALCLAAGN